MDKFLVKRPRLEEDKASTSTTKDSKSKNKSTKKPVEQGTSAIDIVQSEPVEKEKEDKEEQTQKSQTPVRAFRAKWKTGRPWLRNSDTLMWCEYCRETEDKLGSFVRKRHMIEGTNTFKLETITFHEQSKSHKQAEVIIRNTKQAPKDAPAVHISNRLDQKNSKQFDIRFRNVHALIKNGKSFNDYQWMCNLDEQKGIEIGKGYRSDKAAQRFARAIALYEQEMMSEQLKKAPFVSITCDGSTDSNTV